MKQKKNKGTPFKYVFSNLTPLTMWSPMDSKNESGLLKKRKWSSRSPEIGSDWLEAAALESNSNTRLWVLLAFSSSYNMPTKCKLN